MGIKVSDLPINSSPDRSNTTMLGVDSSSTTKVSIQIPMSSILGGNNTQVIVNQNNVYTGSNNLSYSANTLNVSNAISINSLVATGNCSISVSNNGSSSSLIIKPTANSNINLFISGNSNTIIGDGGTTNYMKINQQGSIAFFGNAGLPVLWTKGQRSVDTVLTSSGGNTAIDFNFQNFSYTLSENSILNSPSNMPDSGQTQSGIIKVTQAAGGYALAYSTIYNFPDNFNTINTTPSSVTIISYLVVSPTVINCRLM